jgi:WD40 repeat protein
MLEPGLVVRIIRDVGDQPGGLPLLQYALTELFEHREGRWLTIKGYEDRGGVVGALGHRAEAIYSLFDEIIQQAAQQTFLRLVTFGEGVEDTRRRVLRSEVAGLQISNFVLKESSGIFDQVIEAYGNARLLSFDHDPVSRGPTLEIAHEALLREWPRLSRWLDENRVDIRNQRILAGVAIEWHQNDLDPGYLLRGSRLELFESWEQGTDIALTRDERDFLEASLKARSERQTAEKERQARELAFEKRSRRFLQALVGVFAFATIVAVILTIFAYDAQTTAENESAHRATAVVIAEAERENAESERLTAFNARATAKSEAQQRATAVIIAEQERLIAEDAKSQAELERLVALELRQVTLARELAFASENSLTEDPERSVLLALEAIKTKPIIESINALHQALPKHNILNTIELGGYIDGLDFNADETKLAIANNLESKIVIWDMVKHEKIFEIPFPIDTQGQNVVYSPNDRLIAASGRTSVADLMLFDAQSGTLLHSWISQPGAPANFEGYCGEIAFSPDGKRLAVANLDGIPQILDVDSGEAIFKLRGHKAVAAGLAYSPDGSRIATGDNYLGEVIVWDANTGEKLASLDGGTMGIYNMAFSPDGGKLAAVGDEGVLNVWDVFTGEKLISQISETAGYRAIRFSHDGKYLVTGGQDSTVRIWDAISGKNLTSLAGHTGIVISLELSKDGSVLITGGSDGFLKLWEISPGKELFSAPSGISGLTLTPDGSTLVIAGAIGTIYRYDPVTGASLGSFVEVELEEGDYLSRLVFTPDGQSLIAALNLGGIRVYDYQTGDVVWVLNKHSQTIIGVDITSDGKYLVTSSFDNSAIVWDLNSGKLVTEYTDHTFWVLDVNFSLDDRYVISASADGTVHVWDPLSGETIQTVTATGGLGAIEITPDGGYMIGSTIDGFVNIWDANTWEVVQVFRAHTSGSWDSDISADGSRLITAGFEGNAKVWEIPSGEPVATLYGHTNNVTDVAISPDGKIAYTLCWDGLLRSFLLDVDELVTLAESRLTRTLTLEECQTYLHLESCPEE